jgi:hypothetical protein
MQWFGKGFGGEVVGVGRVSRFYVQGRRAANLAHSRHVFSKNMHK